MSTGNIFIFLIAGHEVCYIHSPVLLLDIDLNYFVDFSTYAMLLISVVGFIPRNSGNSF